MPPQGLFLAQEGVEKWAPEASNGIHHCKAFNTNFWYFVQYLALTPTTGGIMEIAYNNIMMEIRKYHFKLFLTPKNYFFKISIISKTKCCL